MTTPFRLIALLLILAPACDAGGTEPAAPAPTAAIAPAAAVARVVFIGQKEACDCTRKRIDDGLAALTAALGDREIPVEHLQADNSEHREAVQALKDLRPFMVAPGIFFFDAADELVGMTQGETTADELKLILGDG